MKKGFLFFGIALIFVLSFSFVIPGFLDNFFGQITNGQITGNAPKAIKSPCTDTCLSFGFECGVQKICGRKVKCGTCTNLHGTTSCIIELCNPICSTGYSNCDENNVNGCETQLGTTTNCGFCGDSCSTVQTCINNICVSPCDLTSASWSVTNASQGQAVRLDLTGTNCDGKTIVFEIKEDDNFLNYDDSVIVNPSNIVFIGTSSYALWVAEYQDDTDGGQSNPPEYYFTASVLGITESITSSISELNTLKVTQPINCGDLLCNGNETCLTCPGDCGSCQPFCGNSIIEGEEQCDCGTGGCIDSELRGATCSTRLGTGYTGTLTCDSSCNLDTSLCVAPCVPNCVRKICGDDGCGGICGTCSGEYSCSSSGNCILPNSTEIWSNELLTNPGFELGNLFGWTISGTYWAIGTHPWAIYSDSEAMSPQSGNYSLYYSSSSSSNYYVYQDVNLENYVSYIDAGTARINASGWGVSAEYDCDNTLIKIIFLDSAKQVILTPVDTGYILSKTWWETGIYNYPIPVGTRYIRVFGNTYENNYDSGSLDSFSVKIKIPKFCNETCASLDYNCGTC
jgi:hypothetical protein